MPALRTYGEAVLSEDGKHWILRVEPHVAVRVRRVFGKIEQRARRRELVLTASEENTRDLEWLLQRYPLEVHGEACSDAEARAALEGRARAFDRRREEALEILSGKRALPPVAMELPPREYQRQAAALARTMGGLLVADELGLGKTVTAITLLADREALPALVVVPAHLPRQWKAEIERFLPFYYVHIVKRGTPYPVDERGRDPDVLITTYHKLDGWAHHLAGNVRTVVFDECQDLRSGFGKTRPKKYVAAEMVAYDADFRLGLSGTPIYNYGEEWYSVFNILSPGTLGSHWEFLREWCTDAPGGNHQVADPRSFGSYLREQGIFLRRTREDVRRELPEVQRVLHEVDSDEEKLAEVEDAATELARTILSQTGGWEKLRASEELSNTLRQATGIAKAPYVAEFVKLLLTDGQPTVLLGYHRTVYEIWARHFAAYKPAWYTGRESSAKKGAEVDRFIRGETPLLVLSLRSGSGLDGLQKVCSRVVFGELDWSPGVLEQCVGRVHRDGQSDSVLAYFLTAREGIDPVMADVLDLKRAQIAGVRSPEGDEVPMKQADPEHVKKLARDYLARRKG